MSAALLLNENWNEYETIKQANGHDRNLFACSEEWEANYLKNLIARRFPHYQDNEILRAIRACYLTVGSPHKRDFVVGCVAKKLGLE